VISADEKRDCVPSAVTVTVGGAGEREKLGGQH
jgi:hypothetical protein